nr:uncharacterized mitochondrial protein AtMg00810-like [Tanacetum cinerariifolium]
MSLASFTVTYTSVYTNSESGRVFWGAEEELSDEDYIPGLEEPQTPPAPQDEDEHEPMFIRPHDHDFVPKPIYPETGIDLPQSLPSLLGKLGLGDKLVCWSSKKQNYVSISTAESEYVTVFGCCVQVLWMRTQLMDYGFFYDKVPIYCDSKSAIAISCNP